MLAGFYAHPSQKRLSFIDVRSLSILKLSITAWLHDFTQNASQLLHLKTMQDRLVLLRHTNHMNTARTLDQEIKDRARARIRQAMNSNAKSLVIFASDSYITASDKALSSRESTFRMGVIFFTWLVFAIKNRKFISPAKMKDLYSVAVVPCPHAHHPSSVEELKQLVAGSRYKFQKEKIHAKGSDRATQLFFVDVEGVKRVFDKPEADFIIGQLATA